MTKFEVRKASCEMTRREYKKNGGYHECIAIENDADPKTLASFDSKQEATDYLSGKTSYISPYPSNGLLIIEEYYTEEVEDGDPLNVLDIAPLHEDSQKYIKDIYPEEDNEAE